MVTGGSPHVADTWIQNFGTLAVEKGPSMAQKRMFHACGKFQIKGKTILMVVGGRENFDPKIFLKTTEYINLDEDATWKQGPELPMVTIFSTFVPSRNEQTVFLVGGKTRKTDADVPIEPIYQLVCDDTPDSCAWEETESKLIQPRFNGLIFPIPNSLVRELCD